MLLASEDVTEAIRTEQAGMDASSVSVLPAVRTALVALQHSFRRLPGLVADGRDMGTVIFSGYTTEGVSHGQRSGIWAAYAVAVQRHFG